MGNPRSRARDRSKRTQGTGQIWIPSKEGSRARDRSNIKMRTGDRDPERCAQGTGQILQKQRPSREKTKGVKFSVQGSNEASAVGFTVRCIPRGNRYRSPCRFPAEYRISRPHSQLMVAYFFARRQPYPGRARKLLHPMCSRFSAPNSRRSRLFRFVCFSILLGRTVECINQADR
jgi:hypothetical protein